MTSTGYYLLREGGGGICPPQQFNDEHRFQFAKGERGHSSDRLALFSFGRRGGGNVVGDVWQVNDFDFSVLEREGVREVRRLNFPRTQTTN